MAELPKLFKKLTYLKKGKGQIGIIFIFLILSLLGIMGISFLYRMKLEEKAVYNYQNSLKADYLAQAGLARAIAELKNDNNGYDDLYEDWAKGFKEFFENGRYDVSFHLATDDENYKESEDDEPLGIFDEGSKININTAGRGEYNQGWSPYEINLGALSIINEQLSSDGMDNDRDGLIDEENEGVDAIINYRYGKDCSPGVKGVDDDEDNLILCSDGIDNDADGWIDENDEGVDEPDEFRPDNPYGDDNPFETVEEIRLVPGIGEATFKKIKDFITVYSYDREVDKEGNTRVNINTASPSRISQILQKTGIPLSKANQIAVNIVDFRDEDNYPTSYKGKYGLEKTPYINEVMPHFTLSINTAAKDLIKGGTKYLLDKTEEIITKKLGEQNKRGLSIIMDKVEEKVLKKEDDLMDKIEKIIKKQGPAKISSKIFRIKAAQAKKLEEKKIKIDIEIEWIELFNPYEISLEIKGWGIRSSRGKRILRGRINKRGYRLIFNIVISIGGEDNGKELLDNYDDTVILKNNRGDIVDKVTYHNYGAPWNAFEKNDPRVREFSSSIPGGSPGFPNWFWMPDVGEGKDKDDYSSFYIKNKPFANIGEIGYIHTGKQWITIKLSYPEGEWQILDKITIFNPKNEIVEGKININTASFAVLKSLPGIDSSIATSIINYGKKEPFKEVGELLKVILLGKAGYNGEDDDKDGYIDEEDEKEMVFRSLSNLITVRSNCYTIVSCGQVIERGEVIAESKIKAIIDKSTSPLKTKYYRHLYSSD